MKLLRLDFLPQNQYLFTSSSDTTGPFDDNFDVTFENSPAAMVEKAEPDLEEMDDKNQQKPAVAGKPKKKKRMKKSIKLK